MVEFVLTGFFADAFPTSFSTASTELTAVDMEPASARLKIQSSLCYGSDRRSVSAYAVFAE